jgi:HAD superfamily hydrolase (TIGR01662 family)
MTPAPTAAADVTVVVPTLGRPSLTALLDVLLAGRPCPRVLVVDDRAAPHSPLALPAAGHRALDDPAQLRVLPGGGRGPAAARNRGWQAATTSWVCFLDDDVVPDRSWLADLGTDLAAARAAGAAGSQGRLSVPLPTGRRPTDWERGTAGLAGARWITADMAYRRDVLAAVGGFDERFPRAYREDAELALRVVARGWTIVDGTRHVTHPVRPAGWWASVRQQAGNSDDVLMGRLHGPRWRERADTGRGRLARHLAVTGAAGVALAAAATGHRRLATAAAAGWAAGSTEFAVARLRPGPVTPAEVARMVTTSALIPPAATGWWLLGRWRHRRVRRWRPPPAAVLFDRDGTLVHDVPYNGDPGRVSPVAAAGPALARLRDAGVLIGVVSNQSGVARGLLTGTDVDRVNRRIEDLLGPIDLWAVCPHGPAEGCRCRKPAPGLILQAAGRLGVPTARCLVIGDIGTDVTAASAAGARAILVPTPVTRPEEVRAAPVVAADLGAAVDLALAGRW